jgi:hypothetical protein
MGTAQVPTGQFNYAFTNTPLWDISGSYTNSDTNNVVIGVIQQQVNGQITGFRTETFTNFMNYGEASGPVKGKVFETAGVVGARLKFKGEITGVSYLQEYTGSYSGKSTDTIDPSTLTIFDSGPMRWCGAGGTCETHTSSDTIPLPAGMTGDWTLDLNVVPNGTKLTGTGTLTLSNGRTLTYQIIGNYKANNQTSKLKLVGLVDAVGTSLSLTTQGAGMTLLTLKGKVLGQKLPLP